MYIGKLLRDSNLVFKIRTGKVIDAIIIMQSISRESISYEVATGDFPKKLMLILFLSLSIFDNLFDSPSCIVHEETTLFDN
jgi:hypothetical protein